MADGPGYASFEDAAARVRAVRRTTGAWPGIRTCGDGQYRLTFDPGGLGGPPSWAPVTPARPLRFTWAEMRPHLARSGQAPQLPPRRQLGG